MENNGEEDHYLYIYIVKISLQVMNVHEQSYNHEPSTQH